METASAAEPMPGNTKKMRRTNRFAMMIAKLYEERKQKICREKELRSPRSSDPGSSTSQRCELANELEYDDVATREKMRLSHLDDLENIFHRQEKSPSFGTTLTGMIDRSERSSIL